MHLSPFCLYVDDFALTSILESEVVSCDINASNVATNAVLVLLLIWLPFLSNNVLAAHM